MPKSIKIVVDWGEGRWRIYAMTRPVGGEYSMCDCRSLQAREHFESNTDYERWLANCESLDRMLAAAKELHP